MTDAGGGVVQHGEQAQVNDDLDGIALRWQNGGIVAQVAFAAQHGSHFHLSHELAMSNNAASASRRMVRHGTGRLCGP